MKKKFLDSLQPSLRHDYEMNYYVSQINKSKPYVDAATATVFWGTDVNESKEKADGKLSKA